MAPASSARRAGFLGGFRMRRIAISALFFALFGVAASQAQEETPQEIIAAHVRLQGYACDTPRSAKPDKNASRPDEAAWILDCGNARYRVRLLPHFADQVAPF